MKQRLLVMNGQRLVQSEQGGQWNTDKVEKAGTIKPGIYNIHLSAQADKAKTQDGVIVYADQDHIYQQVGKSLIYILVCAAVNIKSYCFNIITFFCQKIYLSLFKI